MDELYPMNSKILSIVEHMIYLAFEFPMDKSSTFQQGLLTSGSHTSYLLHKYLFHPHRQTDNN